jgi:UDPglucose 6-dehydrogenase
LTQGSAVYNFLHPDRVVIGTDSDSAFETVRQLYAPITAPSDKSDIPVIRMSNTSAELTKYAANLFLATKISFMNEISRIAEFTKADIIDVIHGIVTDTRIGAAMSNPGCGFGGSCLQKDLKALINQSEKFTYSPNLLKSVLNVNENQKKYFIQKVFDLSGGILKNKIIAVWGISFKRNTDDLRDSVSCDLIEALLKANAIVQAFDPVAGENAQAKFKEYPNFKICSTKEQALEDAYLLVVMTEWPHFHDIDIDLMKRTMKNLLLIDGRNIYDPKVLTKHGISYFAIGKGFLPGD